jgi:transposase
MNAKIALSEFRNGMSVAAIAAKYDLPYKTAYKRLVNANGGRSLTGVTRAPNLGHCVSVSNRDSLVRVNGKLTYKQVAQVIGISASTVQAIYSRAA